MRKSIISALIAILLAGGSIGGYKLVKDSRANTFENSIHTVTYVVDGDTIDIENKKRIRLLGINTPERDACYFEESRAYLKGLLLEKEIRIEKDISGTDRYDRFLRYVYIPSEDPEDDDVFVNEKLIREGYAVIYSIAPDNRYRDLFAQAEREAKENKRGLWGVCEQSELEDDTDALREKDSLPTDPACIIKGNISEKGYGRNYFLEGCPNYNRIKIDTRKGESYFCTEQDAEDAGFTRSDSCSNTF